MVELKGSEKQVKWANDIRERILNNLYEAKDNERIVEYANSIEKGGIDTLIERIKEIDSSEKFIEIRYLENKELFNEFKNDENVGIYVVRSELSLYLAKKFTYDLVDKYKAYDDNSICKAKHKKFRADKIKAEKEHRFLTMNFEEYL